MISKKNDPIYEIFPLEQKPGKIYIEPPAFSDAKIVSRNANHVVLTDSNRLTKKRGLLCVLGKALHEYRTGNIEEDVLLSELPKGYIIKLNASNNIYISGHPSGRFLNAAMFVPHLIWLDRASDESECSCKGCNLPPLGSLSCSSSSVMHEINNCTAESFKVLQKVVIEPPNDIYCKAFIIPIPPLKCLDEIMLSSTNVNTE